MPISLVLPLTPLLNRYYRKFNNRMILSADAIAYKAEVAAICHAAQITPFEGKVGLFIHVYRARKAGDIDGYLKGLMDSIIGYAYLDDKQVTEIHIYRHEDKDYPRVHIEIADRGPIETKTTRKKVSVK